MPVRVVAPGVAWLTAAGPAPVLSPADAERAATLGGARLARFLRGRCALRALLGEGAVIEPSRCPDCGQRHGAPRIAATALFASVSHAPSGSLAAVADRPVGVDVEREGRLHPLPPLALPAGADPLAHWTRVEAVLKADGRGLRIDPAAVAIIPAESGWSARLDGRTYRVQDLRVDPAHVAAVALAEA